MLAGLVAVWRGLRHLEHRGYIYVWANLAAVTLSLPVLTAPAAWGGLMKMSYLAYRDRSADLNDFWEGFRENLVRGVVLTLANAVIIGVNLINLWSYQGQSGLTVTVMRAVWLSVLFFWFSVQLYVWPLFYAMEQPRLWGALRNAAVMVYLNPLFTVGLWIGIVPIIILSTIFMAPWLLLTPGAVAAISNYAVINRLEAAGFTINRLDF